LEAPVDEPSIPALTRNVAVLRARVEAAQARGAAAADAVTLMVVTKSQPPSIFGALAAVGVTDIGENRIQNASARRAHSPAGLTWHGIGHLQRNKARTALETFDVFHALDSLRLARRLEDLLAEADRTWPVYLQVNAAEDEAKGGIAPGEALSVVAALAELPHLELQGFMTMGRLGAEDADLRATFCTLRAIRDEAVGRGRGSAAPHGLSMGMSDDFEVAVEEGATVVRVGTAVFHGVWNHAAPISEDTTSGERCGSGEQT
jgi:pyridoxal phosphate enzyme (YggS family)